MLTYNVGWGLLSELEIFWRSQSSGLHSEHYSWSYSWRC